MAKLLTSARARVSSWAAKALLPYAPGGWGFTVPSHWPVGWWQQGYRAPRRGTNAAVEACVGAISQTVAALPLQHWKRLGNGGQKRLDNTHVASVLRRPNHYQTRADFILNLLRAELLTGNGTAVVSRDDKFRVSALHLVPPNTSEPYVASDGSVFYGFNQLSSLHPVPAVERFFMARDVLHVRLHTPRHPLIGETPLAAAMLAVEAGDAISGHLSSFFQNMTRPSGFLTTPKILKDDVAAKLREMWEKAYSVGNSGRPAVLMDGLEWKPMSITSVDAQLIESYKLTVADVARVYRTPLAVIGEMGGATYANTETLIRHWLATGLSYIVEHVELALDHLFDLPPDEFVAFDLEYLLRADFAARVEGLTKGIQGGLFSPNEAREKEGLPAVDHGDEPRLQAQVVPLSFAENNPKDASAPTTPVAPSAAPPKALDDDTADFAAEIKGLRDAA